MRPVAISYAASLGVWSFVAVLLAWEDYAFELQGHLHIAFLSFLHVTIIVTFCLALLTPPLFYIVGRYPIGARNTLKRFIAYLFGGPAFIVSYATVRWLLMPSWDLATGNWYPRSLQTYADLIKGNSSYTTAQYIVIVIAAHAYHYFHKVKQEQLQTTELKEALARSELQILKTQMQPHFLFNTLHGIGTLISSDPECSKSMILRLSNLLRRSLQSGETDLCPFEDEIRFTEEFLDLEKLRLGGRLAVHWSVEPRTRNILVPIFFLQPLIENSIKHGIACCRAGGWIEIASTLDKELLHIEVRNSATVQTAGGMGLGHQGIRARLRHLYSEDATMSFHLDNQIAVTTVLLPAFIKTLKSQGQREVSS